MAEGAKKNKNKKFWAYFQWLRGLLSWLYEPTCLSKPMTGAECWYTIIIYIMYGVSGITRFPNHS